MSDNMKSGLMVAALLAAYCLVGTMDYNEQIAAEQEASAHQVAEVRE